MTVKCRWCGSQNALDNVFCSHCGTELAKAIFGIPQILAEQWARKFADYGWSRSIHLESVPLLNIASPPFDAVKEIIIAARGFYRNGWLIGALASGHEIFPSKPDRLGGDITITNWRLLITDISSKWVATYPYEHFVSIQKIVNRDKHPIIDLDFGSIGAIRLVVRKIPELMKPPGFLARLIGGRDVDMLFWQVLAMNDKIIQEAESEVAHLKMVLDFFQFILEEKDRL